MMPKKLSIPCPGCGQSTLVVKKEYVQLLGESQHKYVVDCTICNLKVDEERDPPPILEQEDFDPYL